MPLRKALFGACLALPLAGLAGSAHARSPQPEQVIRVPAGAVVLVLPGVADPQPVVQAMPQPMAMPAFPPDFPMLHMMAMQDAMMQQMLQQVRALDRWSMSLPGPEQIIRSATAGMPQQRIEPGTSVVTTMVSNGNGVCRETVTYRASPDGARPQVHVVRTGDQCGALHFGGSVGVGQTLPAEQAPQPNTAPAAAPHHPQLWTVSDPARPIQARAPRT